MTPEMTLKMTPKEFQKICKTGSLKGGYLFFGEEEYLKSRCLFMARKSILGEDDPFNHVKISGESGDCVSALAEQICALPVFAPQKLVEVHSLNYQKMGQGEFDNLAELLKELPEHEECVVILYAAVNEFDPGRLPKAPSAAYKKLSSAVTPVQFSYETPVGLTAWVCKHFAAMQVSCSPETAGKMIEFCSKDMFTLSSEIDKLACYTLQKGKNTVDPCDIEIVCCGRNIEGAFDFTEALLSGKSEEAVRLLSGMRARKERPENILGGIVDTLSGMYTVRCLCEKGMRNDEISLNTGLHAFRVEKFRKATAGKSSARLEKALALCMDADLKIKNSAVNSYTVLDRLVMRLCRV